MEANNVSADSCRRLVQEMRHKYKYSAAWMGGMNVPCIGQPYIALDKCAIVPSIICPVDNMGTYLYNGVNIVSLDLQRRLVSQSFIDLRTAIDYVAAHPTIGLDYQQSLNDEAVE